jgi:hypothetical protein
MGQIHMWDILLRSRSQGKCEFGMTLNVRKMCNYLLTKLTEDCC